MLLITTSAGRWSIPKGSIDPGHTAEQTAAVETLEEAGAIGRVETPALGTFERRRLDELCRITVFALRVERVLERWQEDDSRQREWLSPQTAAERCANDDIAAMILSVAKKAGAKRRRRG